MPLRFLFLIRSLEPGGTERQLVELVKGLHRQRFPVTVVTFYEGGALTAELVALENVHVRSLRKQGRWDLGPFLWRLWKVMREAQPDIMHGYMGVANELSLLMGRLWGAKVVWGIRSSFMDLTRYDWAARWSFRVGAWLSRFPDLIIFNSVAGQQHYAAKGYRGKRVTVIPNGIDTEYYQPDETAGQAVRAEWGVAKDECLIGLVGRLDPMKDHPTFLRGAAVLASRRPEVRFVCVGEGAAQYRQSLVELSRTLGLEKRLIWAGLRTDMRAVYNALDLLVSPSYGEGFSNVIGEAMACGVPCVVTAVGDSARIVGEMGVVVPAQNPEALARGLQVGMSRRAEVGLRDKVRRRIEDQFSIAQLVRSTVEACEGLVQRRTE